jgi:hypothetical protein
MVVPFVRQSAVARVEQRPYFAARQNGCTRLVSQEMVVFEIRVVTPAVTSAHGWLHAGGVLRVAAASLPFIVDLSVWRISDYERQWRVAIDRMARGAPTTALVTGYAGRDTRPHSMWALWRDGDFVYVQPHIVVPRAQDDPFDPGTPEAHLGARVGPEHGLPIAEWRVELVYLLAAAFGPRWPQLPH